MVVVWGFFLISIVFLFQLCLCMQQSLYRGAKISACGTPLEISKLYADVWSNAEIICHLA